MMNEISWIADLPEWSGNAHCTHTQHNSTRDEKDPMNLWTVTVPPLLGKPPGVPRLPYLLIVIINKGVIQNVSGRHPTSLLRTVTFPVHQVLDSASPPPCVQDTIYRIRWFPFYESRRWGNRDWRINSRIKHGLDFGYMKHGMNSPVHWREFEADCHRTNDLGDSKRADKFWSKLIRNGAERNALGRKPHFLTNDVDGRLRPVAIGFGLGARSHLE